MKIRIPICNAVNLLQNLLLIEKIKQFFIFRIFSPFSIQKYPNFSVAIYLSLDTFKKTGNFMKNCKWDTWFFFSLTIDTQQYWQEPQNKT